MLNQASTKQKGAALIIFAVIAALLATTFLVSQLDSNGARIARDKKTVAALAEAKVVLIGYATAVDISAAGPRLGDMPCPDLNNDGIAETSCGNAAGTTQQANRIGRFPWKTLGVDDLRDGYGERLWYAVSNNFKNNTRTTCTSMGQPGCLNSDSVGTITVRDISGAVIKNGGAGTGATAVIFSPGPPISRQDGLEQDRSCTIGVNCNVNDVCTTTPASSTPKCNPSNYLDILVGTEDNADFVDSSATNGFIFGPTLVGGVTVVNDALAVISTTDLIPHLEKRVANETLYCLRQYAVSSGVNRHPWSTNRASAYPSFADSNNRRFGRIPDTFFTQTQATSSGVMSDQWPGSCKIASSTGWWLNWKELVFYAVAYDKDPESFVSPVCNDSPANDCLTITTPSGTQIHKAVAVAVAGRTLAGQIRSANTDKQTLSNYLEGENISTISGINPDGEDTFFEQKPATATFNDTVVFY